MKFLRIAAVLAIALCLAGSVYAETTSVKVSGDLTIRGLHRSDYEYRGSSPKDGALGGAQDGFTPDSLAINGAGTVPNSNQTWFMSTAEVQVDAELTDNVSTVIRLYNQRDWNVQNRTTVYGSNAWPNQMQQGTLAPGAGDEDFNVQLDLAYVTLKNFIYCPLTVTIGRQDLWFGKGFIVGSNQVNNNWYRLQNGNYLQAPEYTTANAFDSVKAVLDYDPWTITGVYSQIWNNAVSMDDGVDLWGVNVGYKFDCYKAEAEAYWFLKRDRSIKAQGNNNNSNDVNTIGIRGSMDPIDCVTLSGEIAGQFGSMVEANPQSFTRGRAAWALDVAAEYRGLMDCWAWKPKGAVEYILYSGDSSADQLQNDQEGTYTGWDRMFRGKYDSAIREWVGTYYTSYAYQPNAWKYPTVQDASFTNQSQLIFSGTLQPMDCLTLKGNYNLFWALQPYMITDNLGAGNGTRQASGTFVGQEIDLQAIWDYTEDVSFGILGAWFAPNGDVYYGGNNDIASDIVGTVKVSF